MTNNQDIRFAKSAVDYIFRWMAIKFLPKDANYEVASVEAPNAKAEKQTAVRDNGTNPLERHEKQTFVAQADAPVCSDCGSLMMRSGNCYK